MYLDLSEGKSTKTIVRPIARGDLEAIKLWDSKQSSFRVTGISLDHYLLQVQEVIIPIR